MVSHISWVFTALSLLGAFVNSKGNLRVSSWIWLCANIFWFGLDLSRELYAQSALYLAFISMNLLGLSTASKRGKSEQKATKKTS